MAVRARDHPAPGRRATRRLHRRCAGLPRPDHTGLRLGHRRRRSMGNVRPPGSRRRHARDQPTRLVVRAPRTSSPPARARHSAAVFGRILVTGSHEASIDALLDGRADCAAIDETVWDARVARDPRTATLRVIDRTAPWPAPPFSLVDGLDKGLAAATREVLLTAPVDGLESIAPASDADYLVFRDGLAASRSLPWPSP